MDYGDQYEAGVTHPTLRQELLAENKWRASRYGHSASFYTRDGSNVESLGNIVKAECDRLGIDGLNQVYATESGSERQRRILNEGGIEAVCSQLQLSP